ncbi:MAG TPA: hypothetical protein VK654_17270 [Nitrospirota bacterium]|nr:hypothetical protein [Nitrospirota bacterium]
MPDVQSMIGKEVEVIANGVVYRGVLVEVSDTDIHLKSRMQWMSLPVSMVNAVRLADVSAREPEREGIGSEGGSTP